MASICGHFVFISDLLNVYKKYKCFTEKQMGRMFIILTFRQHLYKKPWCSYTYLTNRDHWLEKNCLQEDAVGKKMFAQTTTQKKIVCLEEIFIPPPKK